jgi:hypothetical protein
MHGQLRRSGPNVLPHSLCRAWGISRAWTFVSRRRIAGWPWFIGLCCWLSMPLPAWSQWSAQDTLTTRSVRGRDVLRVQSEVLIPSEAVMGIAKFSVTAPKPSPADRELVLVFYCEAWNTNLNDNRAYRLPIQLAEGQTSLVVELPFHCQQNQTAWDVAIYEDGRDIEDKRGQRTGVNWSNAQAAYPSLASLHSSDESETTVTDGLEELAESLSQQNNQPRTAGVTVIQTTRSVRTASTDWRTYLTHPLWLLSSSAATEIAEHTALAAALRNYVASGGLLLIYGVDSAEQLAAVEQVLAGKPSTAGDKFWTASYSTEGNLLSTTGTDYLTQPLEALHEHPILRQLCFGSVLVTSDGLPDLVNDYWKTTLTSLANTQFIDVEKDGDWFWRNLIRAVGKPPVWIFCGMVALFGALLGPGLLVVTARLARRSLMIFLVPAISLVATLAIVSYGVLHEGFLTHVRVTSVQAIDTSTQTGFVWSRQNYFSGLPPREGIRFSPQTYAREVAPENDRYNNRWDGDPRRGVSSTITVLPDRQVWTGWLKPRQQQQLLVGHSSPRTELPIAIERSQPGEIRIVNCGSRALPMVLLRGARYDYYLAQKVAAGEGVSVKSSDLQTTRAQVAKSIVDYRPTSPPELGEGGSLMDFGSGRRRYSATANFYELDDILNVYFKQRLSDDLQLPPFGFAILATESEHVEVPVQGQSTENLHLLMGTHAW